MRAEINAKTEYNFSPLFFAVAGHDALVELLLKARCERQGAKRSRRRGRRRHAFCTPRRSTAVPPPPCCCQPVWMPWPPNISARSHLAVVKNGSTARVLIDSGSDTVAKDEKGRTVLDRLGAEGSEWFSAEAAGVVRAAIAAGNKCCLDATRSPASRRASPATSATCAARRRPRAW